MFIFATCDFYRAKKAVAKLANIPDRNFAHEKMNIQIDACAIVFILCDANDTFFHC